MSAWGRTSTAWRDFWLEPGSPAALGAARIVIALHALWLLLSRPLYALSAMPAELWATVPASSRWRYLLFPDHAGLEAAARAEIAMELHVEREQQDERDQQFGDDAQDEVVPHGLRSLRRRRSSAITPETVSGPRAWSSGTMRESSSRSASAGIAAFVLMGVSIEPGQTVFARRPRLPYSTASVRVKASTPPFDAPYAAPQGMPRRPAVEATFTIAPPPRLAANYPIPARCRTRF